MYLCVNYLRNWRCVRVLVGLVCYSVCLPVCTSITHMSHFYSDLNKTSPPGRGCEWQAWSLLFLWWKGQYMPKVKNLCKISKILNFHSITWNLKSICRFGYWLQSPIIFEINIGQILKSSIFIRLTWNLKINYLHIYPYHRRWMEVMLSPLSICLLLDEKKFHQVCLSLFVTWFLATVFKQSFWNVLCMFFFLCIHVFCIQIRLFFKWFFTIEKWGQKLCVAWYLKKWWTSYAKTRWMSWLRDETKPIWFWLKSWFRSDLSVEHKM